VALGVAREQLEFAWDRREQRTGQPPRDPHAFAAHVGAGIAPEPQRLRVAPELDADFLEDRLGIGLDDFDGLRVEQFDRGDPASDVGQLGVAELRPRRAADLPRVAARRAGSCVVVRQCLSCVDSGFGYQRRASPPVYHSHRLCSVQPAPASAEVTLRRGQAVGWSRASGRGADARQKVSSMQGKSPAKSDRPLHAGRMTATRRPAKEG
jgi:hypothetical protein